MDARHRRQVQPARDLSQAELTTSEGPAPDERAGPPRAFEAWGDGRSKMRPAAHGAGPPAGRSFGYSGRTPTTRVPRPGRPLLQEAGACDRSAPRPRNPAPGGGDSMFDLN